MLFSGSPWRWDLLVFHNNLGRGELSGWESGNQGRDSPGPPLVRPVAFDGGLCGDGACRFFRDDMFSWPLLPLRIHFLGQLLFPFGRPSAVHSLTPSPGWLTPQGYLTSLALSLTPCSFTWSCRKENRKEEWSVIEKPTIHVFGHEMIRPRLGRR